MVDPDALYAELQAVLREIDELQEKVGASASSEDRQALEHGLKQLVDRKVAIEEEIDQATGASR
ncbi:hypothetical protein G3545_05170 [Starkeya sp. ORNL1]|uniref:hypothetical protein n=1 Tax=Starkeya sp. ORNL1 TaxID=2709380 RepID=UPI0014644DE3|nr:hypothetical protein [Starkeya sp. ORNL1]QJP13092.1 hypothetical protein G3545_05170 [Starkeya sp. ORNL1]